MRWSRWRAALRYRLAAPDALKAMSRSLQRYGQIAPVVICQLDEALVLIDGFKRLEAARHLKGFEPHQEDRDAAQP